jgi:hypothetical protein
MLRILTGKKGGFEGFSFASVGLKFETRFDGEALKDETLGDLS